MPGLACGFMRQSLGRADRTMEAHCITGQHVVAVLLRSGSWQLTTTRLVWEVEGLHLRVDRAAGSRSAGSSTPVEYARARSVFVGNLHFDTQVWVKRTRNNRSAAGLIFVQNTAMTLVTRADVSCFCLNMPYQLSPAICCVCMWSHTCHTSCMT